jgi:hypothetical protein
MKVFVSYSHVDASLVSPIVRLLRVNRSLVFQDVDDIRPGKKWREELARGLAESELVVLFWCDHSRQSGEVAKEWGTAIQQEKDVLPLLLDATPLPDQLREYQWINFRDTVGTTHSSPIPFDSDSTLGRRRPSVARSIPQPPSASIEPASIPSAPRPVWRIALVTATIATALVITASLLLMTQAPGAGSAESEILDPVWVVSTIISLLVVVAALFLWRRKASLGSPTAPVPSTPPQRQMASEIEAEILRRAASHRSPDRAPPRSRR